MLKKRLGRECDEPSDNDNFLLSSCGALVVCRSSIGLDRRFFPFDIDAAVLLDNVKLGNGVQCRSILDIASSDIETCYTKSSE